MRCSDTLRAKGLEPQVLKKASFQALFWILARLVHRITVPQRPPRPERTHNTRSMNERIDIPCDMARAGLIRTHTGVKHSHKGLRLCGLIQKLYGEGGKISAERVLFQNWEHRT